MNKSAITLISSGLPNQLRLVLASVGFSDVFISFLAEQGVITNLDVMILLLCPERFGITQRIIENVVDKLEAAVELLVEKDSRVSYYDTLLPMIGGAAVLRMISRGVTTETASSLSFNDWRDILQNYELLGILYVQMALAGMVIDSELLVSDWTPFLDDLESAAHLAAMTQ